MMSPEGPPISNSVVYLIKKTKAKIFFNISRNSGGPSLLQKSSMFFSNNFKFWPLKFSLSADSVILGLKLQLRDCFSKSSKFNLEVASNKII